MRPARPWRALRHFHEDLGDRIWGRFGFVDGFSEQHDWYADTFLAIRPGADRRDDRELPQRAAVEAVHGHPRNSAGMKKLGFRSPHFA